MAKKGLGNSIRKQALPFLFFLSSALAFILFPKILLCFPSSSWTSTIIALSSFCSFLNRNHHHLSLSRQSPSPLSTELTSPSRLHLDQSPSPPFCVEETHPLCVLSCTEGQVGPHHHLWHSSIRQAALEKLSSSSLVGLKLQLLGSICIIGEGFSPPSWCLPSPVRPSFLFQSPPSPLLLWLLLMFDLGGYCSRNGWSSFLHPQAQFFSASSTVEVGEFGWFSVWVR